MFNYIEVALTHEVNAAAVLLQRKTIYSEWVLVKQLKDKRKLCLWAYSLSTPINCNIVLTIRVRTSYRISVHHVQHWCNTYMLEFVKFTFRYRCCRMCIRYRNSAFLLFYWGYTEYLLIVHFCCLLTNCFVYSKNVSRICLGLLVSINWWTKMNIECTIVYKMIYPHYSLCM